MCGERFYKIYLAVLEIFEQKPMSDCKNTFYSRIIPGKRNQRNFHGAKIQVKYTLWK